MVRRAESANWGRLTGPLVPITSRRAGRGIACATVMETGSVSVNLTADAMAKAISADGKVAVYGLYFDTDRTELRPDSKPSLDEIAKLPHENPKLNVYVVGHTDNQGSLAHNLDLAQKRSESIVRTLIGDYKINAGRLLAKGVASFAPVATNETEAGRAQIDGSNWSNNSECPRDSPAQITLAESILALLSDGLRNAAIAKRLFVSTKTVDHHVSSILTKLGVPSPAEAVAMARKQPDEKP